ncbi:MAG TPA: tetratricopeptide repeat protein, partial [Pirellulales bacterium]|nr:tetratricopeptide repeat protein [Pirellulales bacterium]
MAMMCSRKERRRRPKMILAALTGSALLMTGLLGGTGELSLGGSARAADTAPPAQVDVATKKLMAANGLFQRGLFKLAADEYADFLNQYPKHAEITSARYALAVCYYRLSDFARAVPLLQQVAQDEKFEQRDEALAVLGHSELSDKHYDKAVAAFDTLLAKFPASKHAELAAIDRGQALYLAGKPREAAEACEQFLTKYPKSEQRPAALYSLALAQRSLGQNAAAVSALEKLAKESPDSRYALDAMLLQGQMLEAQGKLDAAIDAYRQMLAKAPAVRMADARYSLAVAL